MTTDERVSLSQDAGQTHPGRWHKNFSEVLRYLSGGKGHTRLLSTEANPSQWVSSGLINLSQQQGKQFENSLLIACEFPLREKIQHCEE